jgi:hypothetical protein
MIGVIVFIYAIRKKLNLKIEEDYIKQFAVWVTLQMTND